MKKSIYQINMKISKISYSLSHDYLERAYLLANKKYSWNIMEKTLTGMFAKYEFNS